MISEKKMLFNSGKMIPMVFVRLAVSVGRAARLRIRGMAVHRQQKPQMWLNRIQLPA